METPDGILITTSLVVSLICILKGKSEPHVSQ